MRKLHGLSLSCSTVLVLAAMVATGQAQSFETLVSFDGANGATPLYMALTQGADARLYGTTSAGGSTCYSPGCGTTFKATPNGDLSTLYQFCGYVCGFSPLSSLVLGIDGNFYGTTYQGGNPCEAQDGGCGSIFKVTPDGVVTTLYTFCAQTGCPDGGGPLGLLQAPDGDFYGVTTVGGVNCTFTYYVPCGTVFKITPTGALTTLHSFCEQVNKDGCADGSAPTGLVQGFDGNFYGTTTYGGLGLCKGDCGTIFRITGQGTLTTLHQFNNSDGAYPFAGLLQATDGNLYGTTSLGGPAVLSRIGPILRTYGTIFKITRTGRFTTLHVFSGIDGDGPEAALTQGTDGYLYGTTSTGGDSGCNCGTLFRISAKGKLATLHSFVPTDGVMPTGALIQHTNGIFYGTTSYGGPGEDGTIFSLDVGLGPFVAFVRSYGKAGQTGGILGQGFTGTTSVSFNGTPANFTVVSDTYLKATVPPGATTGYVTVTTPSGVLTSNVPFRVIQ